MDLVKNLFEEKRREVIDADLPFPHFIKALRLTFGLKLQEVAKWCGLSRFRLYYLEAGKTRQVEPEVLELLGELYGIPAWIMKAKYWHYWTTLEHYEDKE